MMAEDKKYCEVCGISEDEYGFEFVLNKHNEWICEEHLERESE